MDKRPTDIIEDDFSRVVGLEFKGSLVGGEGKLISYFHKTPPMLFGQFYQIAGGEVTKERLGNLNFEAKNEAFES